MRFAIHGATGRMGLTIVRLSRGVADLELVGGACAPGDPAAGRDLGELAGIGSIGVMAAPDVGSALLGADVVIDFSTAAAVPALLAAAAQQKVAVVSGTTALDENGQRALDKAATSIAVLWAPNTSIGVHVLSELVEEAVRKLAGFDVEIVETHHRKKVDAPSGTARRLAEAAKAGRPELSELHAREGIVGPRTDEEIGVMALRGGDVIGDHTVFLFGNGERLELTHRATSRDLFAEGALRAARLLVGKPAGRYTLADVLRR